MAKRDLHLLVHDFFEVELRNLIDKKNMSVDQAISTAVVSFPEEFGDLKAIELFDAEVNRGNLSTSRPNTKLLYKLTRKGSVVLRSLMDAYFTMKHAKTMDEEEKLRKSQEMKKLVNLSHDELMQRLKAAGEITHTPKKF